MKTSLLLVAGLAIAVLSIAPANADWRTPRTASASVGCSGGVWPSLSTSCKNWGNYKTYAECTTDGVKNGWRSADVWWYCSSLTFKN
jgi:hypothetical protein